MSDERKQQLLKTIFIFVLYMFYTSIVNQIFNLLNINNDILIMFISDILFLIVIISMYYKKLKNDILAFIKNYSLKEKIFIVCKYVILIFLLNIFMGIITEIFIPAEANKEDANASSIENLFELSTLYTLFKTLIFATIAEELLFRESIHEVIENKKAFVIISAFIYTTINIIYNINTASCIWIDYIAYLLAYLVLSIAYLKNSNNIFIIMVIKFCYNLIPTLLLILQYFGLIR